jgi:hypothetical protein
MEEVSLRLMGQLATAVGCTDKPNQRKSKESGREQNKIRKYETNEERSRWITKSPHLFNKNQFLIDHR